MNISKYFGSFLGLGLLLVMALTWSSASISNAKTVKFTYEIPAGCDLDSLKVYTFTGVQFREFQTVGKEDNVFHFELPLQDPQFYFVGPNPRSLKSVILGSEKLVQMKTDCDKYTTAGIVKSKMNQEYQDFLKERNALNKQSTEAIKSYRVTKADNITKKDSLNQLLAQIDQARLDLPKTFKNDFVRKIAQLFTYQSYQNHGGEYDVEIEYFADNYFANADLSDPMYNQISVVYEVFKNYTSTLTKAKLQSKVHSDYIEKRLSKLDQNGMAYKYALGAVVNTLFNADHKNMPHFASRYVNKYYDEDKAELGQMKLVVDQINANTIGAEAPDIVLNSPEDKELALSELKGKIVLIDFWASWCGPCRRENPNVVRMYDKYKDKGFEIYGVSLDSKKDRWVSAIEADGLTWPNVSDLKGWQSYAAKMYAVRSIPTTVLIDKEGKILARNLRGPTLEAKLEELFN